VPLFWFWANSSWRSAFKWGWLSGTIFFFTMFSWMTNSLGDFIGNWKLLAGVLLGGIEGVFFAILAALVALVCRGVVGALAVFAVPAAWLLVESIRTRGSLGVPFGELGLAAAHLPWLLPVAAFAGVYGLSAVFASFNGALLGLIAGTRRARIAGSACIAILIVLVAAADISRSHVVIPPPTLRVGIAQGNISQRDKWSPSIFEHTMAVYADLTRSAADKGAKVVVWPETAVTSYPLQDPSLLAYLERLASANHVWLLAGTIDRPQKLTLYNTVIALTPKGTLLGEYKKHILVPFAEYLPLDQYLRGVPLLAEASQFVQGPGPTLLRAGGMSFGVLICYESAFSTYAREISNAGADALIIVTDDAWFGQTSGPYQHADLAVIDAVETGRWVIRGGDTGISEFIDPTGKVVDRLGLDNAGVVVADIGPPVDAPYLRWGVLWLLVLALGTLVAGLLPRENGSHGWRSRRGRA
jgi:apolipoprotein N-acyltransferase